MDIIVAYNDAIPLLIITPFIPYLPNQPHPSQFHYECISHSMHFKHLSTSTGYPIVTKFDQCSPIFWFFSVIQLLI